LIFLHYTAFGSSLLLFQDPLTAKISRKFVTDFSSNATRDTPTKKNKLRQRNNLAAGKGKGKCIYIAQFM